MYEELIEDDTDVARPDANYLTVDARDKENPKPINQPWWYMYGLRGRTPALRHLSPYEFRMHYKYQKTTFPFTNKQQ
eukprot:2913069-Prorocentrum_lima.AAC.1